MKKIDEFTIFISSICFVLLITLSVFIIKSVKQSKFDQAFLEGKVPLSEYCDKVTNGGTSNDLPVICYSYFRLERTGTRKQCGYNPALKITTCRDIPILEATQ